jgi:cyclase
MGRSTLIVARMNPADADAVAGIFGDSDRTDLPHLVGVRRRTLFSFHDLYVHLVEADETIAPRLDELRAHPLFLDVNQRLAAYMRPYDPGWKEPRDSMAHAFYEWSA